MPAWIDPLPDAESRRHGDGSGGPGFRAGVALGASLAALVTALALAITAALLRARPD